MPFLAFAPPTGPYAVGQADVMWEGGAGRRLVVRIFYPSRPSEAETCGKAGWLPTSHGANAVSYAESYARFFWKPGVTSALVGGLGFLPLMSSVATQTLDGAALADDLDALDAVVFSHGLGGNRSCYSAVCIELASHGYLVICPEHCDGSASISILPDKSVVPHRVVPGTAVVPQIPARIKRGFTRTLIPEEQPSPLTQHQVRNTQLQQRAQEMCFIADCLEHIGHGRGGGSEGGGGRSTADAHGGKADGGGGTPDRGGHGGGATEAQEGRAAGVHRGCFACVSCCARRVRLGIFRCLCLRVCVYFCVCVCVLRV